MRTCPPPQTPFQPSMGPRAHHNGAEIRDAVTKYCLSPQDTRFVRGIVTSYIKWVHQTICYMTAHLRHNIIQRDVGGREQREGELGGVQRWLSGQFLQLQSEVVDVLNK